MKKLSKSRGLPHFLVFACMLVLSIMLSVLLLEEQLSFLDNLKLTLLSYLTSIVMIVLFSRDHEEDQVSMAFQVSVSVFFITIFYSLLFPQIFSDVNNVNGVSVKYLILNSFILSFGAYFIAKYVGVFEEN